MRIVFLAWLGLLGGCASDPAARQRMIDPVQAQCLAEAKNYTETGAAKDYFIRCVDSRLVALGEEPVYDPAFEDRWPEFGDCTNLPLFRER
ncbi:hypothetical protein ACWJKU_04385 [Methylocaldum sp. MU1018]|jgi:hypothetical protein